METVMHRRQRAHEMKKRIKVNEIATKSKSIGEGGPKPDERDISITNFRIRTAIYSLSAPSIIFHIIFKNIENI